MVVIINHFENSKERLEKENISLIKAKEEMVEALKEQNEVINRLYAEESNRNSIFEKTKGDFFT